MSMLIDLTHEGYVALLRAFPLTVQRLLLLSLASVFYVFLCSCSSSQRSSAVVENDLAMSVAVEFNKIANFKKEVKWKVYYREILSERKEGLRYVGTINGDIKENEKVEQYAIGVSVQLRCKEGGTEKYICDYLVYRGVDFIKSGAGRMDVYKNEKGELVCMIDLAMLSRIE